MAVIFDTTFDDDLNAWTWHSQVNLKYGHGCSADPMLWTGSDHGNVLQQLIYDSAIPLFSIRFQVAITDDVVTPETWPWWIGGRHELYIINGRDPDVHPSNIGVPWSVVPEFNPALQEGIDAFWMAGALYVYRDGSLGHSGLDVLYQSAAGALPLDGTFHGIQVTYSSLDTTYSFSVYVDNVSVLSGTYSYASALPQGYGDGSGTSDNGSDLSYCLTSWGYTTDLWAGGLGQRDHCTMFVPIIGLFSVSFWGSWNNACQEIYTGIGYGHIQIASDADVVNYPACDGIGIPIWSPAVTTGMTLNAPRQLTLTGTNFVEGATINLWGPDGTLNVFTVGSFTSTRIVLIDLNPPLAFGDEACVTITNPCL